MVIKAAAVVSAATPATPSTIVIGAPTTLTNKLSTTRACPHALRTALLHTRQSIRRYRAWPNYGVTTPGSDPPHESKSPFHFETGYALCAKRPSRPLPRPFTSPPSSSFSDPLTSHHAAEYRGERIRALNNGDDAVLVAQNFLGVNDGVGAWATREHGHAGLWSRLLLHFWALEVERDYETTTPDTITYLQRAYEETEKATMSPNEWYGTTTSVTALLHCPPTTSSNPTPQPTLYVTNLGDCKVLVIRPSEERILFKTQEQWHWFDCPMQLGTNSIDSPRENAALSQIPLQENDIVLALSDGVLDNLWEHEVLGIILESMKKWETGGRDDVVEGWAPPAALAEERMVFVAREVLSAALAIAQDPFAESPYMEKAIGEGMVIEGGKMDDISVVVGSCKKRES